MFSFSKPAANYDDVLGDSGKKPGGADHKLILLTLQDNCSLAGGQGRPALNCIGLTLEFDVLPRLEPTEFHMILLRIDFFHRCLFDNISLRKLKLPVGQKPPHSNRRELTLRKPRHKVFVDLEKLKCELL